MVLFVGSAGLVVHVYDLVATPTSQVLVPASRAPVAGGVVGDSRLSI